MKKLVIAGRGDRLGARIKNALAGHDFAKRIGSDFTLAWDPEDQVDAHGIPFADLFDLDSFTSVTGIAVVELDAKLAAAKEAKSNRNLLREFGNLSDEQIANAPERVIHYIQTNTRPAQDKNTFARMAKDFDTWPLNASIGKCISELSKNKDRHQWMAVHLRRGDILEALISPSYSYKGKEIGLASKVQNFVARYAPLASYINAISESHPYGKLAFFSDDDSAVAELIKHFPDRSVSFASLIRPYGLSPSQVAMVEFCLLCQFSKILGTTSAFSSVPAELSGACLLDVRQYITAEQAMVEINSIFSQSKATDREDVRTALRAAYAWHFKMTGRTAEFEAMAAAIG